VTFDPERRAVGTITDSVATNREPRTMERVTLSITEASHRAGAQPALRAAGGTNHGVKYVSGVVPTMNRKRATVTCPECDLRETFEKLAAARGVIETHRSETGHEATWELHRLSSGVERAGDEAGVCGPESCPTTDSPLYIGED
jgi:hypothetical protein